MPRDDVDVESRRQQIMDAALQVIATKGYEKATNRDIARVAQVKSPGLIYHYFKDKWDLFEQAITRHAPALQMVMHSDEFMELEPREALTSLGLSFMATLRSRPTISLFRVMFSEAMHRPAVAEVFNRIGPGRMLPVLSRYLSRQMDLGRLTRADPGAAARCFAGPLVVYFLTREVFVQPDSATLEDEVMVRTAVDIFLRGLELEPCGQDGAADKGQHDALQGNASAKED